MKKKPFVFALVLIIVFSFFTLSASAQTSSDEPEDFWGDFIESLPDGIVESDNMEDLISKVGAEEIFCQLWFALSNAGGGALSFLTMLFGLSLLFCVGEFFFGADNPFSSHIGAACTLVGGMLIFSYILPLVRSVSESINEMSSFFSSLLPIFTGILATSGNVNSASAASVNMSLAHWGVSFVADTFLLPLSFSLFLLSLLAGFSDGHIASVSRSVKSFFVWLLGISSAVILGVSSLQSVISSASDSAYLRAAKYAASGMIPMVGSTVSSVLSTLAGGLFVVKSSVGVGSVAVLVALALSPLLTLLLYRLCFSVCLSFLEFASSGAATRLYTAFRSAFDGLIAVYSLAVIVYISQVVIFINSGVQIFG